MDAERNIIISISGASGVIYATRLLLALKDSNLTVHLVISKVAYSILVDEVDWHAKTETYADYIKRYYKIDNCNLKYTIHSPENMYASIASGSFPTLGMIVCPCSMKTLAGISNGLSQNLIERAADVTLKERRRLVLVTRETPLSKIHLKNMLAATDAGAIILPASPAFYLGQNSMNDMVDFIVGRVLNLFEIKHTLYKPWSVK
jgi:4-hydroxy-3-polyprenylbenzoate decarboxylase